MKVFRSNKVKDVGYSLVEILVAITLFVVVSAITGTLIVQANQVTRQATSAAFTQSQLLDVVQRISREVAVSDPITVATPTKLETLTVRDGKAVRTQFVYVPANREIRSKTSPLIASGQPVPALDMSSGYNVVARNVDPPSDTTKRLLAYVDSNSTPLGDSVNPLSAGDLSKVARVKIDLNANLDGRSKPLTLITSMATRLGTPAGWDPPSGLAALTCPLIARDLTTPSTTATLNWRPAQFGATSFNLKRSPDWPVGDSRHLVGYTTTLTTMTDSTLAAGTAYTYTLEPRGPAAPVPALACLKVLLTAPLAPVLTSSIGAYPSVTANVSWLPVAGATGYRLQRSTTPGDTAGTTIATTGLQLSTTDGPLTRENTYYYHVYATFAGGDSPISNEQNVTPLLPDLALGGSTDGSRNHTLTWSADAIPETASYKLYRRTAALGTIYGPGLLVTTVDNNRPYSTTDTYQAEYTTIKGTIRLSNNFSLTTGPPPALVAPALKAWPHTWQQNNLSWGPVAGATRYIPSWSLTAGGTYTDLPVVNAPADTSIDVTASNTGVLLGGYRWYKVRAYSSAAATPVSPESTANRATQYPVSPVTTPATMYGIGATASGNPVDGTNHLEWNSVPSSRQYQVYYGQRGNFGMTVLTGALVDDSLLTYDHEDRNMGSRFEYIAVGLNACHNDVDDPSYSVADNCPSPNIPGGTEDPVETLIYQRPSPPADWAIDLHPTLVSNQSGFAFTRNADWGNTVIASKFCDEVPTPCDYQLVRQTDQAVGVDNYGNTLWTPYMHPTTKAYSLDAYTDDTKGSSYWGRKFDWKLTTKNPGGWSNYTPPLTTNTYPGTYWVTAVDHNAGFKMSWQGFAASSAEYTTQLTWDVSAGTGVAYMWRQYDGTYTAMSGGRSTAAQISTAGREYDNVVYSQANNGLTRRLDYRTQTPPATVTKIESRFQCTAGSAAHEFPGPGWRAIWDFVNMNTVSGHAADESWYQMAHGTTWATAVQTTVGKLAVAADDWSSRKMTHSTGQNSTFLAWNWTSRHTGVNNGGGFSIKIGQQPVKVGNSPNSGNCSHTYFGYVTEDTANYPHGGSPIAPNRTTLSIP